MSKEMWDFDFNGDFFFEKVINGFFYELFIKWKEFNVNYDVSIIFFLRMFYDVLLLGNGNFLYSFYLVYFFFVL